MKRIQQELGSIVGKDNAVEESHIHKLPYLLAVLKETPRLYPILPLLVPHCPNETATIGGYTIPKGSRVFVNMWAIHRDPYVWDNPLHFDPSRFLDSQLDFKSNDFGYLPFGSGRGICTGIALAEKNLLYFVATLMHSFDWRVPQGQTTIESYLIQNVNNHVDMSELANHIIDFPNNIYCVLLKYS
ncbi:carnosic acid synthase-like [Prosopis cineraria]|uniref:carnosic acid synthase-like n=1 Tax=Prosopis cineraria TaxID=364024 RepID=UPI00240F33CD|nr:carnosic acid synthase-like [Prosopis cineraria]